jgi:hypothetical protein
MTTATLRRPGLDPTNLCEEATPESSLQVARQDITFASVRPGSVHVAITVHNLGGRRSAPTTAALMAAPLGAFVPWRPLALLPVPALGPGESAVLTADVPRPATAPLGPPDRVAPRRLLTALGAEDDRPRARARARGTLVGGLPADLMELLRQPNAHWAGNLNVFIGGRAVERHLAQALRVYPGRLNLAMFVVGSGRDAYRFHLIGEGEDWNANLFDMTDGEALTLDVSRVPPVVEDRWIEVPRQRMMILALRPPRNCRSGSVEVHVLQRSSGQTAVVEFSLDPNAAGPGCFVV